MIGHASACSELPRLLSPEAFKAIGLQHRQAWRVIGFFVLAALRRRSHYPAFDRLGVAMLSVSENTRLYEMLVVTT